MKIGDKVFVHGYVDEIRKDIIIIRNEGGYFGTVPDEILPSAQPERKWIPCSERLPEARSGWKNVTVLDESGDGAFTYSSVGFYLSDDCWIVDNEPMYANDSIRVIAWMPLPEPYREGGQDENR